MQYRVRRAIPPGGQADQAYPRLRSCMGDLIAMAVREYGSIPPWLTATTTSRSRQMIWTCQRAGTRRREAYWLRAMDGADSPAAQEEDLTTQPTKEAPQVASAAQEIQAGMANPGGAPRTAASAF